MTPSAIPLQPKVKYKKFNYKTEIEWKSGKRGESKCAGRPGILVSSPPEFRGEAGLWTPEEFYVSAIETCALMTFLALAGRKNLSFLSYRSSAEGDLEFVEGGYRFTRVTVRPVISISDPEARRAVLDTIMDAHKKCLITRSATAEVVLAPEIRVETD